MQNPNRPRGYEDRLLSELKSYVSERTQNMTTEETTPAPRFSRGKKFSLAGGIGAVTLGIGAVVALPALTASPAYAVEPKDDGTVRVEVNSPEDAEGLEETLADFGIKAKVDFPPDGMMCNPDRFTPDDGVTGEGESIEMAENEEGTISMAFTVDPDNYPIDGDTTLIIEISEGAFDEGAEEMSLGTAAAKGEVGECDPIESDFPDEEGGDEETLEGGSDVEPMDGGDKGTNEEKDDDGSKSKDKD